MRFMSDNDMVLEREPKVQTYELLYIVPNKYTEDEIPQIQSKVKDLISKAGGENKKEVNYGKRRLAYPINHNHYGYYLLNHFDMDGKATKELNKSLLVQDEVIRHLITVAIDEKLFGEGGGDLKYVEDKPQRKEKEEKPATSKKPSITDAKATSEEKQKMAKGSSFDLEKELGVTAEEAKEALESEGKEKAQKEESVDLESLESKLDEIMGDLDKE